MNQLPRLFLRFFRWYCHPRLLKPIEGDLLEMYRERLEQSGQRKADLLFIKDVLLLCRKDIIKPIGGAHRLNHFGLLQCSVKVAFRHMMNRKLQSSLKISGLVIGFGCYLLIQSYVGYHQSFDRFHHAHNQIHRVDYLYKYQGSTIIHSATSPPTIAPFISTHVPGVKDYVRILHFPNLVFRFGPSIFREDKVFMADPSFFQIFDFQVLEGNPATALDEIGSVMISHSTRKKYFGEGAAVGQTISIDGYEDYVITGVFEDPPANSHLDFEIVLSFETAKYWFEGETETDWTSGDYHSYLLLDENAPIAEITNTLQSINQSTPQAERDKKFNIERIYGLTPLTEIHLNAHLAEELDAGSKGNKAFIQLLQVISLVILAVAFFNYASQSSARLLVSSKELGIRKALGASRRNLLMQFLVESFIVQTIGLIIALAVLLIFSMLQHADDPFYASLHWLPEGAAWTPLLLLFILGFFLTSIIPVLFVSSLDYHLALKGKLKSGLKAHQLRKTTVAVQLVASAVLITSSLIMYLQLDHIRLQEPGIQLEKTLIVKGPTTDDSRMALFRTDLRKHANIIQVGSGEFLPGLEEFNAAPVTRADQQDLTFQKIKAMFVNEGYLDVLEAVFIAGRNFNPDLKTDTSSVIINRSALMKLGFEHPEAAVDAIVQWGSGYRSKIVGVVEDYRQASAKTTAFPMIFWFYPEESTHLLIRYTGSEAVVKEQVAHTFHTFFKADPFDYFFLEDHYSRQFEEDQNLGTAFFLFTVMAVLLACIGLYALIYGSTQRKTKEIGIRKVFGAGIQQIIQLLSKELLYLYLFTLLLALPVTYWLMTNWLSNFALRIELSPLIFIQSALLTFSIVSLTVGYQTYRAAIANPVNSLRDE